MIYPTPMKFIAVFFVLFTIHSCNSPRGASSSGRTTKPVEVIVASYKVKCTALAEQSCFLIKLKPEDEWTYYYNDLDGFDYEEGYEYVLLVKKLRGSNDITDASDFKYELVEIRSKTPNKVTISPLYDTWGLLELNGVAVDIEKMRTSPLMDINTQKRRILGSTGCNSFNSEFEFDDDSQLFVVSFPLKITTIACDDNSIESEFLKSLEKVDSYKISGRDLYLMSKGKVLFKYRKVD